MTQVEYRTDYHSLFIRDYFDLIDEAFCEVLGESDHPCPSSLLYTANFEGHVSRPGFIPYTNGGFNWSFHLLYSELEDFISSSSALALNVKPYLAHYESSSEFPLYAKFMVWVYETGNENSPDPSQPMVIWKAHYALDEYGRDKGEYSPYLKKCPDYTVGYCETILPYSELKDKASDIGRDAAKHFIGLCTK